MRTARSVAPQYRQQVAACPVDAGRATRGRPGRPRFVGDRIAGNRPAGSRLRESRPGETRTGAVRSVGNRFVEGSAFPDHCGSSQQGDGSARSGRSVSSDDRVPWAICGEVARNGAGSVAVGQSGAGRGGPGSTATGGTALRTGRDRVCTASPRSPRGPRVARSGRRSPVERVLVGVAVALCSAVVVVVLGLMADLAAASHAGGDAGPQTVQQDEPAVPTAPVR